MSGLFPRALNLKKGAIVMLLKNLNAAKRLLNGTRLIVRKMYDNMLDLEVLTYLDLSPSLTTMPSTKTNTY